MKLTTHAMRRDATWNARRQDVTDWIRSHIVKMIRSRCAPLPFTSRDFPVHPLAPKSRVRYAHPQHAPNPLTLSWLHEKNTAPPSAQKSKIKNAKRFFTPFRKWDPLILGQGKQKKKGDPLSRGFFRTFFLNIEKLDPRHVRTLLSHPRFRGKWASQA